MNDNSEITEKDIKEFLGNAYGSLLKTGEPCEAIVVLADFPERVLHMRRGHPAKELQLLTVAMIDATKSISERTASLIEDEDVPEEKRTDIQKAFNRHLDTIIKDLNKLRLV